MSAYYVYVVCGLTIRRQFIAGGAALFAALGMFAAVWMVQAALESMFHPALTLAVMIAVGGLAYPILLFLISGPRERDEFKALARRLASRDMDGIRRFLFS